MALTVLYRDEYYVAVNKPAGLLVHPTPEAAGERDTVISRLPPQLGVDQVGSARGRGGDANSLLLTAVCGQVWPVHRLDRGTSGSLVLALSSAAAAALSAAVRPAPLCPRASAS